MTRSDAEFDAFISYSHRDKAWVVERLLPALEEAGLRVAIDFRDFPVGPYAEVNMERAVAVSRRVVLVMSPDWLHSPWSQVEYRAIGSAKEKVLPLLIAPADLPDGLRRHTYADFVTGRFESEMARVIANIRAARADPVTDQAAVAAPSSAPASPASSAPVLKPTEWKLMLADLLVRSGKAHPSSRRALCLEMRVDPDELTFLESNPKSFAIELVSWLDATGAIEGLFAMCRILEPMLRGEPARRLDAVRASLVSRV